MSDFCIISEFNPLHNGHAYIIGKARELGAESVTCVMSGNSTQRGELSVVNKYLRAEAAVRCGADLVVELPYPWCSSGAEYFGRAAVSIARQFGDEPEPLRHRPFRENREKPPTQRQNIRARSR